MSDPKPRTRPHAPARPYGSDNEGFVHGLTKREDMAARLMAGLLANPGLYGDIDARITLREFSWSAYAVWSVRAADALIAALEEDDPDLPDALANPTTEDDPL